MSSPFDSAHPEPQSEQNPTPDSNAILATEPKQQPESDQTSSSSDWFYAEIAPQAIRYAMSIVRKWADAEEIVQESFYRLIKSPTQPKNDSDQQSPETDSPEYSRAQLFTIVRNLAIDQVRTNKRRRFEPIESAEIPDNKNTTDESRLNQLETGIQQSLSRMPSQWSDALRLKINGNLTYAEISDVLQATHTQVRTWIFRARKQLELDLIQDDLLDGGKQSE